MSDPVSNHDIEDVLSSIRRLVAQGDPRRSAPAAKAATPKPSETAEKQEDTASAPTAERLVLTPAFRVLNTEDTSVEPEETVEEFFDSADAEEVMEEESGPTVAETPSPTIVTPEPFAASAERAALEAKIAELEAAVNGRTDEFEPDGSEVTAQDAFAAAFFESPQPNAAGTEPEADMAPVAEEPADVAAEAVPGPEDSVNAAVMDHIVSTVADEIAGAFPHLTAADEEPDLDQTVIQLNPDRNRRMAFGNMDAAEPATTDEATVITPTLAPDEDDAQHFETSETLEPSSAEAVTPEPEVAAYVSAEDAPIAEPEIVEPVVDETPTFRRAYRDVYDPVAEATADAAEASPDAGDIYGDELAPDPEEPGTAVAEAPAPAALMDPDMLRDMVGQMIREELQGEMGERITRNVRKLVRREINRVLSAQDFG